MADLLADKAISEALARMPGWTREGEAIVRTFERRDWNDAIGFVVAVAPEAEARNHHPDVWITGYRKVTFRLTTHSKGGLTQRDLDLAARIDELA